MWRILYIHVWASALLFLDRWAMRDALESGTSNRYSNPHFLFICTKTTITKNRLGWGGYEAQNYLKHD